MKLKASEASRRKNVDEPMTGVPSDWQTCCKFIDEVLRPRFQEFLSQMRGKRRLIITESLSLTMSSLFTAVDQKIISLGGCSAAGSEEFKRDVFLRVTSSLFSSEMAPEFTVLLIRVFKFSHLQFEVLERRESVCFSAPSKIRAAVLLDKIAATTRLLCKYQSSAKLVKIALRRAAISVVDKLVRYACEESNDPPLLGFLNEKLRKLLKWASKISLENEWMLMLSELTSRMERNVVDQLTKQIFNLVIVDYPESAYLIDDLRYCMQNNGGYGRSELVETLSSEIKHRLLHVGVGTTDILQGYASAVECLRRLDPTCVIMQRICSIIRKYVKQRPDTVRCIITYITGEKREELGAQLTRKKAAILDEEELEGVNDELIPGTDDASEQNWREWMADPPDAIPGQSRRFRQNADVFNMLVSVYGSKELFVKEYRQLLAERLTKAWNRDPHFEMRYLELLKLRFSEGELQQCEVMLKDMYDSEKVDRFVNSSLSFPISARIISSFFWPKIEDEKFKLPEEMMKGLEEYAKAFEAHKASRKLEWLTGVGCVQMEIELDGNVAVIAVSPAHYAVISLFSEKETWTTEEMAEALKMDKRSIKKRLEWWQNSGIVVADSKNSTSETEKWHLGTGTLKMDRLRTDFNAEEETSDDEKSEDTAAVDALEQYWTYTKNLMLSQEPLKPERLYNIYRMLSSPGQQGPSLEAVIAFLQRKVKLNLLSCTNGLYKVVKETSAQ